MGIGQAGQLSPDMAKARGAAANIFAVIDRTPLINTNDGGKVLTDMKGNIHLKHVNFTYPSRPEVPVLKDFSLKLKPGTVTALVGQSGSGKSTVVQLIERFYDPDSGTVKVDGCDIKDLDLYKLREQIGLVSQEPILFQGTIFSNILHGNASATKEQVIEAAKMANAHDFIMSLSSGYDTQVGEKGTQMSGGQKQRIAIARAVLKNPKVLLLDEATSALDTESEKLVQDALERLMKDRTSIVIAHRLTTIRDADKICVLSKGQLKEVGTHQELLDANGIYAHLVSRQLTEQGLSSLDAPQIHSSSDDSFKSEEGNSGEGKKKNKNKGSKKKTKESKAQLLDNPTDD